MVIGVMVSGVFISKRHMQSVADFLAAGRTGGRYIVAVSAGVANLGAITTIAFFEQNYLAGFTMAWWNLSMAVVILLITVSGWVVYRFRQSRALTIAQFFEVRYSRNFRIFSAIVSFVAGIINFGIFPAVGARFFIYFCGIPESYTLFGLTISTFATMMIVLLSFSLFFVFVGGQIAVMITDFIQGTFVNIVFIVMIIYLFMIIDFEKIVTALQTAPAGASMINPFKTGQAKDFNFWFFLIGIFGNIYHWRVWQGEQAYNSSAKSAHEAKMGQVLSNWRELPRQLFFIVVPICAYTIMNHSDFSAIAGQVNTSLEGFDNKAVQSQLTTPFILTHILPVGLMGAFTAVMLAAFVSTHDTYLHSWGAIFIQDVLLPLRRKPLTPEQHIKYLRWSIIGVACFAFIFSLIFQQSQYILLFFAITGAIYAGGAGAVLVGGLYWKRGTTTAAYAALITGATVSVGGITIQQFDPDFFINGQVFYFLAMVSAIAAYILCSLFGRQETVDLDRLLHRGEYAVKEEYKIMQHEPRGLQKILGMGKEFTPGDKFIYWASYTWIFCWFLVFVAGTILNIFVDISDSAWMEFWYIFLAINFLIVVAVVVWFTIGGIKDVKYMLHTLSTSTRDHSDDGSVK